MQISDAATGTVLDTESISSFTGGVYLDWKVSGNLLITITRTAGANAVLNGLFLDASTGIGSSSINSLAWNPTGGHLGLQTAGAAALSPGAAGPAPQAAAVDLSARPASAVSVPVTAKGPRPDGNLQRTVARRFAHRPTGLVQQPRLKSGRQAVRPFGP